MARAVVMANESLGIGSQKKLTRRSLRLLLGAYGRSYRLSVDAAMGGPGSHRNRDIAEAESAMSHIEEYLWELIEGSNDG